MLQIPLENKQLHHTFELYEKKFKALSDKKKDCICYIFFVNVALPVYVI